MKLDKGDGKCCFPNMGTNERRCLSAIGLSNGKFGYIKKLISLPYLPMFSLLSLQAPSSPLEHSSSLNSSRDGSLKCTNERKLW